MIETTKKALFATVGAPVLTARRVNEKFQEITSRLRDADLTEDLRAEFDAWAAEGEKLLDRFGDQPMIEELSSRFEDMHMPAQVSKLREQLDEMVESWRASFRPATESVKVPVEQSAATAPAAKSTASKATTKKPAAKAASTTAKKPAAKTTAAKKPAAKSTASKATTKKA